MSLRQLRNLVLAEIGRCVFDFDSLFLMEQAARRAADPSLCAGTRDPSRQQDFAWFADACANLRRKTKRKLAVRMGQPILTKVSE